MRTIVLAVVMILAAVVFSGRGTILAEDFTIDGGTTLEDLRPVSKPVSGDTVTLHADDGTLTEHFTFTGATTLTVKSNGGTMRTISGATAATQNHASAAYSILTPAAARLPSTT